MKIKGVNVDGLPKSQQPAMARHSRHHTRKHLRAMVTAMRKGRTFTQSHRITQKKVGK